MLSLEGFLGKAKDKLISMKNKATREFEFLARNEENAEVSFALRKLSKQKNVSADRSIRFIDEIVKDLSPAEYDLFTRKVILDDLAANCSGLRQKKENLFLNYLMD